MKLILFLGLCILLLSCGSPEQDAYENHSAQIADLQQEVANLSQGEVVGNSRQIDKLEKEVSELSEGAVKGNSEQIADLERKITEFSRYANIVDNHSERIDRLRQKDGQISYEMTYENSMTKWHFDELQKKIDELTTSLEEAAVLVNLTDNSGQIKKEYFCTKEGKKAIRLGFSKPPIGNIPFIESQPPKSAACRFISFQANGFGYRFYYSENPDDCETDLLKHTNEYEAKGYVCTLGSITYLSE